MIISQNSLMGNIKKNTSTMLEKAKTWTAVRLHEVENLAEDKSPRAKRRLEKIADEHDIPYSSKMPKSKLVERIKDYLYQREGDSFTAA